MAQAEHLGAQLDHPIAGKPHETHHREISRAWSASRLYRAADDTIRTDSINPAIHFCWARANGAETLKRCRFAPDNSYDPNVMSVNSTELRG